MLSGSTAKSSEYAYSSASPETIGSQISPSQIKMKDKVIYLQREDEADESCKRLPRHKMALVETTLHNSNSNRQHSEL